MNDEAKTPTELDETALDDARGGLLSAAPASRRGVVRPPSGNTSGPDVDSDGTGDIIVSNPLPPT